MVRAEDGDNGYRLFTKCDISVIAGCDQGSDDPKWLDGSEACHPNQSQPHSAAHRNIIHRKTLQQKHARSALAAPRHILPSSQKNTCERLDGGASDNKLPIKSALDVRSVFWLKHRERDLAEPSSARSSHDARP
jgi:hypothetical protein